MRCLHCGKALPLLKRLSGGEFCSEAHRREYQQEYSELALTRLLQAMPPGPEAEQTSAKSLGPAGAPEKPLTLSAPAPNGRSPAPAPAPVTPPALASPQPGSAHVTMASQGTSRATSHVEVVRATEPAPAHKPAPPQRPPAKEPPQPEVVAPAGLASVVTHKPAAASPQVAATIAPEVEWFATTVAPNRPNHPAVLVPAGLVHASNVAWETGLEIQDSAPHAPETRTELRSFVRPVPAIDFRLSLGGPRAWNPADQSVEIPVMPVAAPAVPALWQAPPCNFAGSVIALGEFADLQFLAAEPAQKERGISDLVLQPAPVTLRAMEAGRAKPVQVFTSWLPGGLAAQIPRSEALPLRPLMVLAPVERDNKLPAPSETHPAAPRERKADVRILAPEKKDPPGSKPAPVPAAAPAPVNPPAPAAVSLAAPSTQSDLGLPELRVQPSGASLPAQIWRIVAAVAGVLILVVAIFMFTGSNSGSEPKQTVAASANEWIADFAPDAKRQRRVSVLRSSVKDSDYRVEFESAIQIKALGWVYRAQDPKNFYVNKIELKKPGEKPAYVIARYAVINSVDQPRAETPIPVRVPVGENYKIRFEAAGNRFITWVQDQKVDEWTDDRLKSGGVGLYSEGIEQASLHGVFHVAPLDQKLDQKKDKRK